MVRTFKNYLNGRRVNVWVFGEKQKYNFCVNAGANSDYSYTGSFYPVQPNTIEEMAALVDAHYETKKLFR